MSFKRYKNLEQAKTALNKRGFNNTFKLEGNELRCIENNRTYRKAQLRIAEFHRFDLESNPLNSIIIFAIEGNNQTKGTIISKSGPNTDISLRKFMDKVKIKFRYSKINRKIN